MNTMSKWYVKDLSKLTKVSVQTLHHYDRIGLLKPSVRLPNGYRLYSEQDLLRLEQIIALKFFGFDLSRIKEMLSHSIDVAQHFQIQERCLAEKAQQLFDASNALKTILTDMNHNESIPWKTVLKLIEVYRMAQNIEHAWVKDIFTAEELKQYATFEAEWKRKSTPQDKIEFQQKWAEIVANLHHNLSNDPESKVGIDIGRKCMELMYQVYGKKYVHLRNKKFEKGFGEGRGLAEVQLTPETVVWLEKAVDAYWRDRVRAILDKVETGASNEKVLALWNETLDEMCGEDVDRREQVKHLVMKDEKTSARSRAWLKAL